MPAKKSPTSVAKVATTIFRQLGLSRTAINAGVFAGTWSGHGPVIAKHSPIDGSLLGRVATASKSDYAVAVKTAQKAFPTWRDLPGPKRGEVVRQLGMALRELKVPLARLVSLEAGKILAEGEGEVQEMIDICDFAVGISRQHHSQ